MGKTPDLADRGRRAARLVLALGAVATLAGVSSTASGQAPYAGDGASSAAAGAAARGEGPFRTTCGFCHGAQAHGSAGPDLTRSPIATADPVGKALAAFLKVGRPAVGMPAFPDLADGQIADMAAYIRSQASTAQARPRIDPNAILVGDAKAGEAFFNGAGRCVACHSPTGDLRGVGARYTPMVLQGRMINPRVVRGPSSPPPAPTAVTVTEPNGRVTRGTLVSISDFHITLVDASGARRSFDRDNKIPKVEVHDPAEAHRQMMMTWKDRTMWDVTAYLAGLK